MKVHAVTSWDTDCGIAEYARHLQEASQAQGLPVEFTMDSRWLDPSAFFSTTMAFPDVVWLNYHAGLHSRWTPEHVRWLQDKHVPVVITYHDTYDGETTQNSPQCKALFQVANAFIVHEPVADLEGAIVLRQGIPDLYGVVQRDWRAMGGWDRPTLGTVGFPFPWKNYDRLAQVTGDLGWGLLLIAPRSTDDDVERWRRLNPWTTVAQAFLPASHVVGLLASCHVTAFMYECYNTGTSGAIRQGIAARKPVYALAGCRQFRDLLRAEEVEESHNYLIRWCESFDDLRKGLKTDPLVPWDPGIVWLAERDSWRQQAKRYAAIFAAVQGAE